MLTSLFSLFYVTDEFHRFLHRGRAREVSVELFFPFFNRTTALEHGVRRWENERFKSDVRSTLQTNVHTFFVGLNTSNIDGSISSRAN